MNRGVYVLVLRLDRPCTIAVGRRSPERFAPGYYAYVGSARVNLEKRLARHLRLDKKLHWHVDYLRPHARVVGVRVRRTERRIECQLSREVAALADRTVARFGSSDCRCPGHLHFFRRNPLPLLGDLEPFAPPASRSRS